MRPGRLSVGAVNTDRCPAPPFELVGAPSPPRRGARPTTGVADQASTAFLPLTRDSRPGFSEALRGAPRAHRRRRRVRPRPGPRSPRPCTWSDRGSASTATWATNVAMQDFREEAGTNPRSPVARRLRRDPRRRVGQESPGPGSSTSVSTRPRRARTPRALDRRAGRRVRARRRRSRARGSTWSSCRRIRRVRASAASAGLTVGDNLAVLEAAGADVTREYYFNDHGAQIDRFAHARWSRAPWARTPRGRLRRLYIPDILPNRCRGQLAAEPDGLRCRDEDDGGVPRARRRPDVRRDQAVAARLRRRLRRCTSTRTRCTESGAVERGRRAAP